MSPLGVTVIPYGPRPSGAGYTVTAPSVSTLPYQPACPVNHNTPSLSNAAVLRLASAAVSGSGYSLSASLVGSTRMIELRPPSVTQAAPSAAVITPWGRDPSPRSIRWVSPDAGSSRPRSPESWAVNQMPPSAAGLTSCGPDPAGTGKAVIVSSPSGDAGV